MNPLTINMEFSYEYTIIENTENIPSIWNLNRMHSSKLSECSGIWISPKLFHQVKKDLQNWSSVGQNRKKCEILSNLWQYLHLALSTNFISNKQKLARYKLVNYFILKRLQISFPSDSIWCFKNVWPHLFMCTLGAWEVLTPLCNTCWISICFG